MFSGGFQLELLILILASIVTISIGVFTFSRNPQSATNKLFAFIAVCLVGWSVVSYLSLRSLGSGTLLNIRATFACVVLQNTGFLFLSYTYPSEKLRRPRKLWLPYLLITIAILVLLPSSLVIKSYDGTSLIPGPFIVLFMVHAIYSVVGGFTELINRLRRSRFADHSKVLYLFVGSLILWGVVPLTNFILPIAFKNHIFVRASALYMLLFAVIIAYAIIKHRLFDIRLIVARSIAYVATFGFFVLLYSSIFAVLTYAFLPNNNFDLRQLAIVVLAAVVFSPTVSIVKRFFDKATNKLFYRDAYDSQLVLAQLNTVLVSTIKLSELLKNSSSVITTNLKLGSCSFAIFEDTGSLRIEHKPKLHLEGLRPYLKLAILPDVTITDDLQTEDEESFNLLRAHNIGAVIKLSTHVGKVGYILLGEKLSGNTYSEHDTVLLRLIANELAIAVQNALRFEQIENFTLTLQQKVNLATRELRRSNEKLKALDEAKDEFISMASHQLRTPLTSVKGYLSMLDEGDAGKLNATQKQFVNQAFISSQRMVYLIADLLNVSRLKTGKFIIESAPVYLPDLIESEIAQLYETVKSRGLKMSYDKPKTFPMLNMDETKIRQVVMNFTDNAIYYTPAGGEIKLALHETAKSIEFTVTDNGIGVPSNEQHHLFTKFYRAGNARKTRPDGTGLGLFMAQKVVVAQGGAIIFKTQEGKGSTFGFSFAKDRLAVPTIDTA